MNKMWKFIGGVLGVVLLAAGSSRAELNGWQLQTSIPAFARTGHAALAFQDKIWVFGGANGAIAYNDVWNSENGITWIKATNQANFPARSEHSALVFAGKMWLVGGINSGGFTQRDVWNSANGVTWTQVTANAAFGGRSHHSTVVHDGAMWLIGGYDGAHVKNDVWRSVDGVTWTLVSQNNPFLPRYVHGSISFSSRLWVLGGTWSSDPGLGLADVWSSSNGIAWVNHGDFKVANELNQDAQNILQFKNKLYVIDGLNESFEVCCSPLRAFQSSDGNGWQEKESLVLPHRFVRFASLVFNNRIWVIGGAHTGEVLASNEVFKLTTTAVNGRIIREPDREEYSSGATVTVTAIPNPSYLFQGWSGNASGADPSTSVFMDDDKSITAHFVIDPSQSIELTVITSSGSTVSQVAAGDVVSLQSGNPPEKSFERWQTEAGQSSIADPKSTNTTATMVASGPGRKIRIRAIYNDPKVAVFIHDLASGLYNDISMPVIRIQNTGKVALTNFTFEYFFKVECFNIPNVNGFDAGIPGLTYVVEGLDPGAQKSMYKVTFTYSGTLGIGEDLTTSTGLLDYSCTDCNLWNRVDDYSNDFAGQTEKRTKKIPVFLASDNVNPIEGVRQNPLPFSPQPNQPPSTSNPEFLVHLPPDRSEEIRPNLIFSQGFQKGNLLSNGSFESEKAPWSIFSMGQVGQPVFEILEHGPARESKAYDGLHSAMITLIGDEYQGISVDFTEETPELDQIFGQTLTFGIWVKGNADRENTSVRPALITIDQSPAGPQLSVDFGPTLQLDGSWQLLTFTRTFPSMQGNFGTRLVRLVIGGNGPSAGSTEFYADGAALVPGNELSLPNVAQTLMNTRAGVLQTRTILPADPALDLGYNPKSGQVIISNLEYDNIGRIGKTYLPFATDCPLDDCNPYFDEDGFLSQMGDANLSYVQGNSEGLPDAEGFAFSQPLYNKDQVATIQKSGAPGRNYQLDPLFTTDGQDHAIRNFFSGVSNLDPGSLGADLSRPENNANPKYSYSYIRDQDQGESMLWTNGFGQPMKAASVLVESGQKKFITSENVYDDRGNLIKVLPPLSCENRDGSPTNLPKCVAPTEFTYDDENRIEQEDHPDVGTTRFFHDLLGNRKITQDILQQAERKATVAGFDRLGRMLFSGVYTFPNASAVSYEALRTAARNPAWPAESDPNLKIFSKYFYDEMPPPSPEPLASYNASHGKNVRLYPDVYIGSFGNSHGQLCAVISRQPKAELPENVALGGLEEFTTTAYRYNKYGKVIQTWKYNGFITDPDHKLQAVAYINDVHGRIIQSLHYDRAHIPSPTRVNGFTYDAVGRLKEIRDVSGRSVAMYSYFPSNGKVKTVELDKEGENPITINYSYDINGVVKSIDAKRRTAAGPITLYNQKLYYDLLPTTSGSEPRFSGAVSASESQLWSEPGTTRLFEYQYDNIKRLTEAVSLASSGGQVVRNDAYSESIRYENDGRIKSLRRGERVVENSGGEYHYFEGTNQLAYVSPGMENSERDRNGSLSSPAMEYDLAGRMIHDHSRELSTKYDFRDLPVEFSYIKGGDRFKTFMRYDEGGARTSKLVFKNQGLTPLDQLIVDDESSRERDAGKLSEVLEQIESRVEPLNQSPGPIIVHAVPDEDGFVDLSGISEITPIEFQGGAAGLDIVGIRPGEAAYSVLLDSRKNDFIFQSGEHFSGLGSEIRERMNFDEQSIEFSVFNDLPDGLGRYSPLSQERLYYIKDHLGSTVASAVSEGNGGADAFAYFPNGKVDLRAVSSQEKITPKFTGKVHEEDLNLHYFGARYLDPELAMWTSPDPLRQFSSPYLYAGNGMNPVNGTDPNGLLKKGENEKGDWETLMKAVEQAKATESYQDLKEFISLFGHDLDEILTEGKGPQVNTLLNREEGSSYQTERAIIKLSGSDFEDKNLQQIWQDLAHEIGHYAEDIYPKPIFFGLIKSSLLIKYYIRNQPDLSNSSNDRLKLAYLSAKEYIRNNTNRKIRWDGTNGWTATYIVNPGYVPKPEHNEKRTGVSSLLP